MKVTVKMLIKTAVTLGLILFFLFRKRLLGYFVFGVAEPLLILALTGLLLNKRPKLAWVLNSVLTLVVLAEHATMFFGNSFISPIMVSNLRSVRSLSGQAGEMIGTVAAVLAASFLPVSGRHGVRIKKTLSVVVAAGLVGVELAAVLMFSAGYSPVYSFAECTGTMLRSVQLSRENMDRSEDQTAEEIAKFYREGVADYFQKPQTISDAPNIVLIFTEGLSQNIIDDDRQIMPNLNAMEQQSIFFENYYNQSAATYRGLIGQLYSGHQFHNNDTNQLISIQSILADRGYRTVFLNSEPGNGDFSAYLESFGFEELRDPADNYMISDKDMYSELFDLLTQAMSEDRPLFVSMYTYGTHVSFDSPDKVYGDGSTAELNKFYNLDYQFGRFMDRLREDPVGDNTVVVFTTDHATYADTAYQDCFGQTHKRSIQFCDTIPLMIWYKDVEPVRLDAAGRNSLDLVPTVLDLLDIDAPNYFLGNSLFAPAPETDELEYYYVLYPFGTVSKTKGGIVVPMPAGAEQLQVMKTLSKYFFGTTPSSNPFD